MGTGGTDCHGRLCALAMTWFLQGVRCAAGHMGPALRKRNKRCNGRATARVAPTKALQGGQGRAESSSHGFAVTAPFRQGGRGDGGTDCHDQFANWSRNDMFFARGCGLPRALCALAMTGFTWGAVQTGRRGRRPLRRVTRSAVGRATARVAPTELFVGPDDPVRPAPITRHLVGQGPCALRGGGTRSSGPM